MKSYTSIFVTKDTTSLTQEDFETVSSIDYRTEKCIIYLHDINDDGCNCFPFRTRCKWKKLEFIIASYCTGMSEDYCNLFVSKLEAMIRARFPKFDSFDFTFADVEQVQGVYKDRWNKDYIDNNKLFYLNLEKDRDEEDDGDVDKDIRLLLYVDSGKYTDNTPIVSKPVHTGRLRQIYKYGNLDEDTKGLLQSFLKENNVSLSDFLFQNKYVVIFDNDQQCGIDTLKDNNLYNESNIVKKYPEYDDISFSELKAYRELDKVFEV